MFERRWHPTPVLLPGKSHGRRRLVGCNPWGRWVGHDWVTSLSLFTFMHWRRKWQPTPVFLPGESQGRGSLVGCRLWGRTESDMTKATYRILGQNKRRLSVIECKLIIIKIYISKYLLWSKWDFYTFLKIHLRFLKIWHASNPSRVYCAF